MQTEKGNLRVIGPARRRSGLGEYWCAFAHDSVTWPVHGYYRCRKCNRIFRVPWDEPGHARAARAGARGREVASPETAIAA